MTLLTCRICERELLQQRTASFIAYHVFHSFFQFVHNYWPRGNRPLRPVPNWATWAGSCSHWMLLLYAASVITCGNTHCSRNMWSSRQWDELAWVIPQCLLGCRRDFPPPRSAYFHACSFNALNNTLLSRIVPPAVAAATTVPKYWPRKCLNKSKSTYIYVGLMPFDTMTKFESGRGGTLCCARNDSLTAIFIVYPYG